MSDHDPADRPASNPTIVFAASFTTPDPRLTERCLVAMQAFVARAGGEAVPGVASGVTEGVIAQFGDAVSAARCAVRASVELRKLSAQQGDRGALALHVGLAAGDPGEAVRLRDAAAPGEILVTPKIGQAVEGQVDVEKVDIRGRRDPQGRPVEGFALTPSLTGLVFRYMPWTTPGRRKFGLIVAAILIVIGILGMLFN